MNVTCERCGTGYDFDDALVSERGTTVKCTNCGHQFKVRKPPTAGAPERWLVRTIDGRELEFRALRELQAAIAQALITRDDVLSRGGSRPRRLGNIAELEPFFASAGGPAHPTNMGLGPRAPSRPRNPTPGGLGVAMPPSAASRPEVSVAIPLPGSTRNPVKIEDPASGDETVVFQQKRPASVPPPPRPQRSTPPPHASHPGAPPGVVVAPGGAPPPPPLRGESTAFGHATAAGDYGHATLPGGHGNLTAYGNATVAAGYGNATVAAGYGNATIAAPYGDAAPAHEQATRLSDPEIQAAAIAGTRGQPTDFAARAALDPAQVRALIKDDWSQAEAQQTDPYGETQARPSPVHASALDRAASYPPARVSAEPVSAPSAASIASEPSPSGSNGSSVPSSQDAVLTPTPAPYRPSYGGEEYAEPRFSGVVSGGRTGAARWIVGLFVAGMLALAFATVGRKLLVGAPVKSEADARIGSLLADGEKSLTDGDLELAKEQFDKASVLAEKDTRVVSDLARLAAAKADVDWLRVRLLASDDPEQSTARRELEQAVQRARRAADRAAEVAPTDPAVARSRVDALRLAGDLDGARKLVGTVTGGAGALPENARVLAALDVAEAKPDWPTVIDRLRTAVGGEGNLGRARSLLVYALARSGDAGAAKAELERLKALQRPHPLTGLLTSYLGRMDKVVDVSSLPDTKASATVKAPPVVPGPLPHEPQAPREPREPSWSHEPREPRPAPAPVEPSPAPEPIAPTGPIDTSDLPGIKAPPSPSPAPTSPPTSDAPPKAAPPKPAPPSNTPPGVDTSDLP